MEIVRFFQSNDARAVFGAQNSFVPGMSMDQSLDMNI